MSAALNGAILSQSKSNGRLEERRQSVGYIEEGQQLWAVGSRRRDRHFSRKLGSLLSVGNDLV